MKEKVVDYYACTEYDWSTFSDEDREQYQVILENTDYDPELAKFFHEQGKISRCEEKRGQRFFIKADLEDLGFLLSNKEDLENTVLFLDAIGALSEVERRRLCLNCNGITENEIAYKEGVSQNAVFKSIKAAKGKIRKYFLDEGCILPSPSLDK